MSLFKLPPHLLLVQKLGNLSLVLRPGSKEAVAAVEPHSLELGRQANLVLLVETQQGLKQLLLVAHCRLRTSVTLGSMDSAWRPG